MTIIKSNITLFKMEIKVRFMIASNFDQPGHGNALEVRDAVGVVPFHAQFFLLRWMR